MDSWNEDPLNTPEHRNLKPFFVEFFQDFREYFAEYIRESVQELMIGEVPIHQTMQLFDGIHSGKAIIKNQGKNSCYIATGKGGGYRLDPEERLEIFINNAVYVTPPSGNTSIGFIRY